MNVGCIAKFIQADMSGRLVRCLDVYGRPEKKDGVYFSSTRWEAETELYLLGNGHRAYHPFMKRFMRSDVISPFGSGGLNSYAYCLNDPINIQDSSGSAPVLIKLIGMIGRPKNKKGVQQLLESVNGALIPTMPVPPLVNDMPTRLGRELSLYQSSLDVFGKTARSTNPGFMTEIRANRDYKFIMDSNRQIITSPWVKDSHVPSHAVLASTQSAKHVIASGHITKKGEGLIELTNRSGHYMPPVESLAVPALYFSSLGYKIKFGRLM